MKVFVVYAETGEYSDRNDWPIVGHRTEARAQDLVRKLEAAAKEQGVWSSSGEFKWSGQTWRVDYTGISFGLYMVEVEP